MKVLDIIIPQYKEGETEIRNLLESIDTQVGIDRAEIQITIVNDHSDKVLSKEFLQIFNLDINYLKLDQNVGSGIARQVGIDNTNAPYIMFCDADDQLYKSDVLSTVLSVLKTQLANIDDWPILQCNFYEENFQQGFQLIKHEGFNMIFLHGKIFNRKFLIDHHIRFRPGLRTFEDTYFCKTCSLAAKPNSVRTLDTFAYVWKRAAGSISSTWNHDGKSYMFWRVDDYIGCNEGALDFFREHYKENPIDRIQELVYHTIVYTYLNYYTADFAGEDEQTVAARQKLIEMAKRVVVNNKEFMTKVPEELKQRLHKECLEQIRGVRTSLQEFRPTFNEFLHDVLGLPDKVIRQFRCTPAPEAPAALEPQVTTVSEQNVEVASKTEE